MKYLSISPYIKMDGQIWSIKADPDKGHSIYTEQMKSIIRQINIMCNNYRRVFWIVFDLHMPHDSYTACNEVISRFMKSVSRVIKSKYTVKEIGYCWCREMEKAKQQHYHFMIMLDGKAIRHSDTLFDILSKHWAKASHGGKTWMPKNCYGEILKADFGEKQKLIDRVSYQAKGRGKGHRDKQAKDYSISRLK
ncbi:YagK/YfjJ domain-containing protein [Marinomonas sp.]|uniref:YagK/YfjJ domain-containing protein n=1 Tax=Marinomonas sp. TaxID=1904862 RepID=UPI003BABB403